MNETHFWNLEIYEDNLLVHKDLLEFGRASLIIFSHSNFPKQAWKSQGKYHGDSKGL